MRLLILGLIATMSCLVSSLATAQNSESCSGWIAIDSIPIRGALIILNGQDTGQQTPTTLKDVPCGSVQLEVSKPFYIAKKIKVQVRKDNVAKLTLKLKQNFGELKITSKPPKAKITIDGQDMGTSPLDVKTIAPGRHKLEATLPDYRTANQSFQVVVGKKSNLNLVLIPAFGSIQVKASPEDDALIYLDNDAVGNTPLTLKMIPSGPHTVRVEKELYTPYSANVTVADGKTAKVDAIIKPNYGTLTVESEPSGEDIVVDGKSAGKAPLTLKLSPGDHRVKVLPSTASYKTEERQVTIKLLNSHRLMVQLIAKTGGLLVDTIPFGAEIELDGKSLGKAPLSLKDIVVGKHTLIAKLDGHQASSNPIEISEGQIAVAEVNLTEPGKSVFRTQSDSVSKKSNGKAESPATTNGSSNKTPETKAPDKQPQPPIDVAKKEKAPPKEIKPEGKNETPKETNAQPKNELTIEPKAEVKSGAITDSKKKPENVANKTNPSAISTTKLDSPKSTEPPLVISKSPPMSTKRKMGWISVSTGAAAGVASTLLFILGAVDKNRADTLYEKMQSTTDLTERSQLETQVSNLDEKSAAENTSAWICLGVAGVATGAALYFFLSDSGSNSSSQTAVQFSPLPEGGGWVGLSGRF